MKYKNFTTVACFSLTLYYCIAGHAAEPGYFRVGSAQATPSIELTYFHLDNVYSKKDEITESYGYQVKPSIELLADKGLNTFAIGYKGDYGRYDGVDNLDYDDHIFYANSLLEFSSRVNLALDAELKESHQEASYGLLTDFDENSEELVESRASSLSALLHYGGKTAKGGLQLSVERNAVDYTANKSLTARHEYVGLTTGAAFLYRVSPDTQLVIGVDHSDMEYSEVEDKASLDRTELFSYIGAKWDLTGKTSGSFKVGNGQQDFKETSNSQENNSTLLTSLAMSWAPLSYSEFTLNAQRGFVNDVQTPSIADSVELSWSHQWSTVIASGLSAAYTKNDSEDDEDDYTGKSIDFSLYVSPIRNIRIGFTAAGSSRDSDDPEKVYEAQRFDVSLLFTL